MHRPRPSILQLFDPLSRDTTQSPDSDKENTLPDSDLFLQIHVKHPSPVRLTRRLVEVGDVTVEFQDSGGDDDEGVEKNDNDGVEEDEDDENDTIGFHPPPSPRTPLGDVTFDRERTPMRSKMYRRKLDISPTAGSNPPPENYAFASVINAVNASGATFGGSVINPTVVICSPDDSPSSGDTDALSTSLATLSLATPTGSLIADTTMAFPTPSEGTSLLVPIVQAPRSMVSLDLDRSSADLQSSFALHMEMNSETSFDLLNDRISFFGQCDEESFEMMQGELGPVSAAENCKESDSFTSTESNAQLALGVLATSVDVVQKTVQTSSSDTPSRSESPLLQLSQETPVTVAQDPCASSAVTLQPTIVPPIAPVFVAPPFRPTLPVPILSTTLPEPPTLVPALKIVKRKRPDPISVPTAAILPDETPSLGDGASSIYPSDAIKSSVARLVPSMVPSIGRYVTEGPGPWRVPNSSIDKEKAPTSARSIKPMAGTTLSGPRRVPLPSQDPTPVPPPVSTKALASRGSGLKRPLRVVPPNMSTSCLPRPASGASIPAASRLPMPKSKLGGGPGGTGLPRRRVA
ncbi:hypothetical protein C8R43DRAFT_992404 [Mycena crocata]|nr:hypothetical protein C8R43DRAFT_992404 [Mycena crocata]